MMTTIRFLLALTLISFCQSALAFENTKPWYVSGALGTFQGNNDLIYNDQTDIILQNIRQTVQQYGYTGGIAFGYSQTLHQDYLLGAELSGNAVTNNAYFSSGASNSPFSDQIKIQSYFDLVLVPGFYITDSVAMYAKGGVSYALVKDFLSSPSGFDPVYSNSSTHHYLYGLALGLGMKKSFSDHMAVFGEYQYHDYRNWVLPDFQNYSTTYSHSVNIYSQALMLGLSYYF